MTTYGIFYFRVLPLLLDFPYAWEHLLQTVCLMDEWENYYARNPFFHDKGVWVLCAFSKSFSCLLPRNWKAVHLFIVCCCCCYCCCMFKYAIHLREFHILHFPFSQFLSPSTALYTARIPAFYFTDSKFFFCIKYEFYNDYIYLKERTFLNILIYIIHMCNEMDITMKSDIVLQCCTASNWTRLNNRESAPISSRECMCIIYI